MIVWVNDLVTEHFSFLLFQLDFVSSINLFLHFKHYTAKHYSLASERLRLSTLLK